MKILITGGAGFIGSNIVDRYIAEGHEVAIVDNLATGRRSNLNPAASFYEVSITDAEAVRDVFERERPEVVSHHAAQMDVRRSVAEPQYDAEANIIGSINVLEAAHATGVRKLIFSSSGGAIYGDTRQMPTPESAPLQPISHYGTSKLAGEIYIQLYGRLYGLDWTILRYANVYGPRQNPHGEAGVTAIFGIMMLRGQRPTIFGAGDKTRDYVFVGDVVEANLRALTRGDREIINIGTGVQTSDREVYDAVAAAAGYDEEPILGPERVGDVRHSCIDASHARDVLGWEPTVEFREGVRRAVEHQREREIG
ncbi:MAG: NAD-dependent epimerase/dehydratase family protein [candidate division WS1 bacterium]|jgi:UDP-glucose 4-epimerase|nr:NAD-dependent epimerase/dehydratase family protein [candidate division WS1 bacterium]